MLSTGFELVGMVAVLVAIAVVKSSINGGVRDIYDWAKAGSESHKTIDNIASRVEDVYSTTERIEQQTELNSQEIKNVEEAIAILHQDDADVNEEELKEKLNVDHLNTDIKE